MIIKASNPHDKKIYKGLIYAGKYDSKYMHIKNKLMMRN